MSELPVSAVVAITILLGLALSRLVGALWARPVYAELHRAAIARLSEPPESPEADRIRRQDVHEALALGTNWYYTPLVIVAGPVAALRILWRVLLAIAHLDPKAKYESFFGVANSSHLDDLALTVLFRRSPVVYAWVLAWLILPAFLVAVFIDGPGKNMLRRLRIALANGRRAAVGGIHNPHNHPQTA